MHTPFGHFSERGADFTITNPKTPRAFDNVLWNETIFSNVQQTGVGYCDYQIEGLEGIQLFTGVGRICDFDVFGRDHLMNRLIYIRDNATGDFWNINWEPVQHKYDTYECTHGLGFTRIRTVVEGIQAEFRIFVPPGRDPVELWDITLKDVSGRSRSLSVFAYNQFQFKYKWGFDSYGDMIFRGVRLEESLNAVVASKHPFRRPHEFLTGFMTSDRKISAYDGSRDAFVGTYNTLARPQALIDGSCTNTPGSSEATIGAVQFDIELPANGMALTTLIIGATDAAENIKDFQSRYFGKTEEWFRRLESEKKELVARNHISTPDKHFNRLVNTWTKHAALFGATWCRWGWMGYRDLVQHGLGVAALRPERTREIIIEAMRHQYRSGPAVRGWNPLDEKKYSDSALWLVFTLDAYLKETGDLDLLDQEVAFLDGDSDSVLGHVERALQFLHENKGSHDLCLIKFGDWNDSLTGVGRKGRGESVWLSQACAEACRLMAALMSHLGQTSQANEYLLRRKSLVDAINLHAWDGEWYLRCFDDEGRPLGSHQNSAAQIFMETQSWALISGMADPSRSERLVASCDRLLDSPVGYRLLAPPYSTEDPAIGRISTLEPGICENGTVYSHVNIWMMLGLLRQGNGDKAYEVFRKITPGYVEGDMAIKQNSPPYIYANCYYGPEHRNRAFQMEFTWITGSLAWFNTVPLQEMLGVKPDFDGLLIQPCLPSQWKQVSIEREFRGGHFHIEIRNEHPQGSRTVSILLDGVPIVGNRLPIPAKQARHHAIVTIGSPTTSSARRTERALPEIGPPSLTVGRQPVSSAPTPASVPS